jgi:hypothetical protein
LANRAAATGTRTSRVLVRSFFAERAERKRTTINKKEKAEKKEVIPRGSSGNREATQRAVIALQTAGRARRGTLLEKKTYKEERGINRTGTRQANTKEEGREREIKQTGSHLRHSRAFWTEE